MPETCPFCGDNDHSYTCAQELSIALAESVNQHNEDLRSFAARDAREARMEDRIAWLEAEVRSLR